MFSDLKKFSKVLAYMLAMVMLIGSLFSMTVLAEETTSAEEEEVSTDLGKAELNDLCDLIIKAAVKDDMTDVEKAYAVYKWVEDNIKYVSSDAFDTWQDGAYSAFTQYGADCFGFYAATRALLQRLGFETKEICSTDGSHCWVMAKVNGYWWHFDNTPGYGSDRFMLTSQEMLDFEYVDESHPEGLRYSFNPDDYPKTEGTDADRYMETAEEK